MPQASLLRDGLIAQGSVAHCFRKVGTKSYLYTPEAPPKMGQTI